MTYDSDPGEWNQTLAIQVNGTKYYAQYDSNLTHPNATDLRVRIGGVTYDYQKQGHLHKEM